MDENKKPAESRKKILDRTIAKDLTIGLLTIISIILLLLSVSYYFGAMVVAEDNLANQIEEVAKDFSLSMAVPVYNYDIETIRYIATAALQSETLVGLSVTTGSKKLFEKLPTIETGLSTKKVDVVLDGKSIGTLILHFTSTLEEQKRLLIGFIMMTFLSLIITITVATRILTKKLLDKPLSNLIQGLKIIADGNYKNQLAPSPHGDINTIINEIHNMSEQINIRSALLQASEEKYRAIYENAVEGIFISSADGRFLNVNPAMVSILGYDSPEDLVHSISDIRTQLYVRPETRDHFLEQIDAHDVVHGFEFEIFKKDRDRIWVSANARAIRDVSGIIVAVEGFLVDISSRKRMEIKLENTKKELEIEVSSRTKDLTEKNSRLERLNRLFVDRELRMKELKTRIKELEKQLSDQETPVGTESE